MYDGFAYVYDKLMKDVNYAKWADYIEKIFRHKELKPSLVLDLGCGTGSFCLEMAHRGYDMIGVDLSIDMLSCARQKSIQAGFDILYLNQDMSDFELYGTVDAVVCLLDSINYLTKIKQLENMFKLVNNYLNPEGLFIFDINSSYKFEEILAHNVFYSVEDDVTYIWQNTYDKVENICTFDLTFFIRDGNLYKRYDETHKERAYTIEQIKTLLDSAGMDLYGIYDDLSFNPPNYESERIFFVCEKRKKGETDE